MKDYFKRKKGTSFIEIVIAILIVACAFLPILRVVDYGSVNTAKIGNYARATRLAQELMEELKHIPFKTIEKDYEGLNDGEWFDQINSKYYEGTQKSIDEFKKEESKNIKEFALSTKIKVYRNEYKQLSEVWFQVEISWYDMGKIENAKGVKRVVRVGNAYYNPEAIY